MVVKRRSFPDGVPYVSAEHTMTMRAVERARKRLEIVAEDGLVEPPLLKRQKYSREIRLSPSKEYLIVSPNKNPHAEKFDVINVPKEQDGSFRLDEENDM